MGMGMPETRYARSGDIMAAYQMLGEGPSDVVIVPGSVSHVELQWEAAGLGCLPAWYCRLCAADFFDKRGTEPHRPPGPVPLP